ncbi:pleiotropic drug resistance protein 3-like isoform X2 [Arachis stenosperma]|uniref:pleiotropic drug resistance protein 3-like isoform X2 n=1 Tax=Arachis stenosperma TaxID=217475 RepID=UPI0025AC0D0D|nr:pleiotropic drug resistance protein 3-like isoform X2 [Arachis stenosperma]
MNKFVPQRTAIYINQNDVHIGEMTVRETLAFSAKVSRGWFKIRCFSFLSTKLKAQISLLKAQKRLKVINSSSFDTRKNQVHFFYELWLLLRYQGHEIAVPVRENHQAVLHSQAFPFAL